MANTCLLCPHFIEEEVRYCEDCYSQMEDTCILCSHYIDHGERYCPDCSAQLECPMETIDEDTMYDMSDMLEALIELYDLLN